MVQTPIPFQQRPSVLENHGVTDHRFVVPLPSIYIRVDLVINLGSVTGNVGSNRLTPHKWITPARLDDGPRRSVIPPDTHHIVFAPEPLSKTLKR